MLKSTVPLNVFVGQLFVFLAWTAPLCSMFKVHVGGGGGGG